MATLGWKPVGDPLSALKKAVDNCFQAWGDDPAYKDPAFKLRQAMRELDIIIESPGARDARRAAEAKPSGQEPMGYTS